MRRCFPTPFRKAAQAPARGPALAVRYAAPEADLVLIRVDPTAAYMVLDAARFVHGETFRTVAMTARNRELLQDNDRLRVMRTLVTEERRAMLDDFTDDEEATRRRQAVIAKQADLARQDARLRGPARAVLQA